MSGARSASVTGRRNALRASVATMREAHPTSLVCDPDELRRDRDASSSFGAGRQMKMFLRFGGSTGAPFGSNGPSIVTVGAVVAPRPVTAVVPGLNVPVLA